MQNNTNFVELLNKVIPIKNMNWWGQNYQTLFTSIENSILKHKTKNLEGKK